MADQLKAQPVHFSLHIVYSDTLFSCFNQLLLIQNSGVLQNEKPSSNMFHWESLIISS